MIQQAYDLDANALYVRLTDRAVARTVQIDEGTLVDLDDSGAVVGIEVIQPERVWPLNEILDSYNIPADQASELRAYFLRTPTLNQSWAYPAPIAARTTTQPAHPGLCLPVAVS